MVEINNKKLCESCFCETDAVPCPYCGFSADKYSPDLMVLPMGTKLEDKYVIGKVIGKGGFGITYLGYDMKMEKKIAVKEYYPNGIAYRTIARTEVSVADTKSSNTFNKGAEKFYDEARMVAKFNGNSNIVGVYDFFRANNTIYLTMEYLNGITLKNYIKKHGKLSDGQALFIIDKVTTALKAIHKEKVLHRDISPDNIMICTDEMVKLIDFGAARQVMAESSTNLTVVMKHGYTPIEQYTKKGAQGAWTDIYSLGASIYYALTEVLIDDPYTRNEDDSEFAENKRGINNDLWNIIKKCTMIKADERFGSAADLRKAIMSVSASIKPEPIVLSEDDLREDESSSSDTPMIVVDDNSSIQQENKTKNDFPVTASVTDKPVQEIKEISKNGNNVNAQTSDTDVMVKPIGVNSTKSAANKSGRKKALIITAMFIIGTIGIFTAVKNYNNDIVTANSSDVTESSTTVSDEVKITEISTVTLEKSTESKSDKIVGFDGKYPGDWQQSEFISKSDLQSIGGDVKITLNAEAGLFGDKNEEYFLLKPMNENWESVNVSAVNAIQQDDAWYKFFTKGQRKFIFTISEEEIEKLSDKGLSFQLHNVIITSAVLESAE